MCTLYQSMKLNLNLRYACAILKRQAQAKDQGESIPQVRDQHVFFSLEFNSIICSDWDAQVMLCVILSMLTFRG